MIYNFESACSHSKEACESLLYLSLAYYFQTKWILTTETMPL